MNFYGYVRNNPVNLVDPLGLAIFINNTGRPLVVSGNIGAGTGVGGQRFGVIPAGQTGGGTAHPVAGYATRAEAFAAANGTGTAQPLGNITDLDYFDNPVGPHNATNCDNKISGDERGPETDINRNAQTGQFEADQSNIGTAAAFGRATAREVGNAWDAIKRWW